MAKRKCKPVDQWTQLYLWPESEREIELRTVWADLSELPCMNGWKPEVFRAGVSSE